EHGTAPGKQAIHEEYARSVFSRPKTAPSAGQLVAPNLPTPPEEHEVADVDWAIRSRGSSVRKPPPLPIASGPIRSIQHQTYTLRCSSAAKLRARTVRLHGEQLINHPDPTVFGRPPKRSAYSEAATDSTNLEPNWDGIIACFDSIRSGEVPAKAAMQAMRKRIQHDNPHVVMHALLVMDACVKNCGHK
ncbi:unnamed protein product, partial [Heligmosomoides polygyrus]|uniref:VHS domain-containing protein n=1 Tax=Heligmosomoides polygyrus TaxID=6339 RepID=A0A183GUJ0_HELPZ